MQHCEIDCCVMNRAHTIPYVSAIETYIEALVLILFQFIGVRGRSAGPVLAPFRLLGLDLSGLQYPRCCLLQKDFLCLSGFTACLLTHDHDLLIQRYGSTLFFGGTRLFSFQRSTMIHPFLRRFSRSSRTRAFRATVLIFALFCIVDVLSLISVRQHQRLPAKTPDVRGQKIFIASIHWNNEPILRSNWNLAVLNLVDYFGAENVYVSVYESGSWDDSKQALRALDNDLERKGVPRTVRLNETTHADEMKQPVTDGWIQTPRGQKELRRIPYLSKLRNLALEPLNYSSNGTRFDKVLFLNDVVFTVRTLVTAYSGNC